VWRGLGLRVASECVFDVLLISLEKLGDMIGRP
jgi:hypothetical protein